jgi:hypothetical protein
MRDIVLKEATSTIEQIMYIVQLEDTWETQETVGLSLMAHLKDENKGISALTMQEASDLINILLWLRRPIKSPV